MSTVREKDRLLADAILKETAAKQESPLQSSDDSMASLLSSYRDYLAGYLTLAELHGQRWILLVCKILVLSLAVFMLLLAGWFSVLTALVGMMMQAGLSLASGMLLASFASLTLGWWCWRSLRRCIRAFAPSSLIERPGEASNKPVKGH